MTRNISLLEKPQVSNDEAVMRNLLLLMGVVHKRHENTRLASYCVSKITLYDCSKMTIVSVKNTYFYFISPQGRSRQKLCHILDESSVRKPFVRNEETSML